MSLFSLEEICEDCRYSNWHDCKICGRKSFCYCSENNEQYVDCFIGECEYKKPIDRKIDDEKI